MQIAIIGGLVVLIGVLVVVRQSQKKKQAPKG
jgi:hypothetical protein